MTGRVIEFPGDHRGKAGAGAKVSTTATKRRHAPRKGARDKVVSEVLRASHSHDLLLALAVHDHGGLTPVDAVCPPGTLLDAVVSTMHTETDLPPETGLGAVLVLLCAALAQAEVTVVWPDISDPVEMATWIVLLAPSGMGKSFVSRLVGEALKLDLGEMPEPNSAPAFIDALATCGGRAYWPRDEYGQLIAQLAAPGPMAAIRDLLLRTYDHGDLENNTRKHGRVIVEHPVLTIYGASVANTWSACVDARMLADGLLARHLFIVAAGRPLSVPRYPRDRMLQTIRAAVTPQLRERLGARCQYRITDEAAAYYDRRWQELVRSVGNMIDAAYVRRATWATARWAVLYHILLDVPGDEIGADAMQWSWRLTTLMLGYMRFAIQLSDPSFAAKIERMLAWIDAHQSNFSTRSGFERALFQRFSRDLGSVSEARQLIDLTWKLSEKPV